MAKKIIFQLLKTLINSFIAGIIIGLCGLGFVICGTGVLKSLFLGLGMLICLLYGYDVFSLKIPYVLENNGQTILETIVSFLGNFIGTIIIALICRFSITDGDLSLNNLINDYMINPNYLLNLLYGLFAGIIIYFGVNTYKKAEQPIAKFLVLFLCCGLVAYTGNSLFTYSTFFVFAYKGLSWELVGKLFVSLLGNILGGLAIPLLIKLRRKL